MGNCNKQCQNYNNKICNILKKVLYSEDLRCYNNSIQIRAAARAEGGCKKERQEVELWKAGCIRFFRKEMGRLP